MHEAMKQHNEVLLSTLRLLITAIRNREIEKRANPPVGGGAPDLSDEEVVVVIRSEAKKRKDAITEFTRGNRPESAKKEAAELVILEKYLPAELSDEEIEKLVMPLAAGRAFTDFGAVMGAAMKAVSGRASGNRVQAILRKALSPLRQGSGGQA